MEVICQDGTQTQFNPGQTRELGRGNGLSSFDKTISRRQVSFFIPRPTNDREETLIQFEVLGRNPIYVSQGDGVKIFRRFERGEMRNGEMFCVSGKNPVWYALREIENGDEGDVRRNDLDSEFGGNLESGFESRGFEDLGQAGGDISGLDPVKEFDFLAMGHEFDSYPKKMFRDIKEWDWFLDEATKEIDEDEDDKGKKSSRRKRKKGTENDDEEWLAESEDDKVLINKSGKGQKAKYMTRSKDVGKNSKKDVAKRKSLAVTKTKDFGDEEEDEDEDEDEDDETLGGFIVDDENLEDEEEIGNEEENEIEEVEELVDECEEDEDE